MKAEDKFWISLWALVAAVILGVVLLSTSYYKDRNTKIVSMISEGVDPIDALCVVEDAYGKMPVCIVNTMKKERKQ